VYTILHPMTSSYPVGYILIIFRTMVEFVGKMPRVLICDRLHCPKSIPAVRCTASSSSFVTLKLSVAYPSRHYDLTSRREYQRSATWEHNSLTVALDLTLALDVVIKDHSLMSSNDWAHIKLRRF
jgi:hypothetical protein